MLELAGRVPRGSIILAPGTVGPAEDFGIAGDDGARGGQNEGAILAEVDVVFFDAAGGDGVDLPDVGELGDEGAGEVAVAVPGDESGGDVPDCEGACCEGEGGGGVEVEVKVDQVVEEVHFALILGLDEKGLTGGTGSSR